MDNNLEFIKGYKRKEYKQTNKNATKHKQTHPLYKNVVKSRSKSVTKHRISWYLSIEYRIYRIESTETSKSRINSRAQEFIGKTCERMLTRIGFSFGTSRTHLAMALVNITQFSVVVGVSKLICC